MRVDIPVELRAIGAHNDWTGAVTQLSAHNPVGVLVEPSCTIQSVFGNRDDRREGVSIVAVVRANRQYRSISRAERTGVGFGRR